MYKTKSSYASFLERIEKEILNHPIILNNKYCHFFRSTTLTQEEVRHFAEQFSIFSNLFLIAQLKKMVNSISIESIRASREILSTEISTLFNNNGVEFDAGHFEWMFKFGNPLGLKFSDIGKKRFASPSTLYCCNELDRLYSSETYSVSMGASYALENCAAKSFWNDLMIGLENFKKNEMKDLNLDFFTWHDKIKEQRARYTHEELAESYFDPDNFLDEDLFIKSGIEMLNAFEAFWNGLNSDRIVREYTHANSSQQYR